jgi:ATP-dependent exoDNAse (exonuclease V) alpha subunit
VNFQGSEFSCTVVALDDFHSHVLTAALLSTAVTRGRLKTILIGQPGTVV